MLRLSRRTGITLLLILGVAALLSTVAVRRYGYRSLPDLPLYEEIQTSRAPQPPYSLGFIQLDDNGRFRSRSQLTTITRRIRQEAASTGAVIVLFVHGWNNTCEQCSQSVKCFEQQLAYISELQRLYGGGQPRKVFGVYVGWRGVRMEPPGYNTSLTFADRRDVADRIGSAGDLKTAVEQLGAVRRELSKPSVLIAGGHSLGARALFKAMTSSGGSGSGEGSKLATLERFADLLVLLNPALSASDYMEFDEEAARMVQHRSDRPAQPEAPKMVVLGSESDYVTQYVYPFSVDRRWPFKLAADEKIETFTTIGNYSPFYTHRLVLAQGRPAIPGVSQQQECGCGAIRPETFWDIIAARQSGRLQEGGDLYDYTDMALLRGPGSGTYRVKLASLGVDRGPFMVVQVDRRLMDGHGGIYTPSVMEFLTRIANRRFFKR